MKEIFYIAKKKLNSKSKIIEIKNYNKNSIYITTKKLEKKFKYKNQSTKKIVEKYLDNFIQCTKTQ